MRAKLLRGVFATCGIICTALGLIGIFLPVLPTTPFLLLAAFLFARSSERLMKKLEASKAYQAYVVPFKENKGIEARVKNRILAISFSLMGVSAFVVRDIPGWNFVVWVILMLVCLWLLYLMKIRIPTLTPAMVEANKTKQ